MPKRQHYLIVSARTRSKGSHWEPGSTTTTTDHEHYKQTKRNQKRTNIEHVEVSRPEAKEKVHAFAAALLLGSPLASTGWGKAKLRQTANVMHTGVYIYISYINICKSHQYKHTLSLSPRHQANGEPRPSDKKLRISPASCRCSMPQETRKLYTIHID